MYTEVRATELFCGAAPLLHLCSRLRHIISDLRKSCCHRPAFLLFINKFKAAFLYRGTIKRLILVVVFPPGSECNPTALQEKEMRRRRGKEATGQARERKGKEENAGFERKRGSENMGEHGQKSNHVCPAEVTTGLQVLIMC